MRRAPRGSIRSCWSSASRCSASATACRRSCSTLGGRVEGAEVGEFGRSRLTVAAPGRLLAGTPAEQACWMSHRDTVYAAPAGFTALASSTRVAGRRARGRGARPLRHPVPPRGRAHAVRPADPDDVPRGRLRLRAHLERGLDHRRAGRVDPRAGRRRSRHLRSLRRRRLVGRGAARAPRGRRTADVRVRRSRADAPERGRAGGRRLPRLLQGPAGRGRRRVALPRAPEGADRARGQAQGDRRRVHPRLRGGGGEDRRGARSSSRARCTRT